MTVMEWLFAGTAVLLVSWLAIAAYIVATDMKARREWRRQEEAQRFRQMLDAYRRAYEND